jgi:hypothetical protein
MEEPRSVINELKAWCAEKYGRNSKVARMLGVSPQLVNDWFSGKTIPTWPTGMKIQAFLRESEESRKKAIGEDRRTRKDRKTCPEKK